MAVGGVGSPSTSLSTAGLSVDHTSGNLPHNVLGSSREDVLVDQVIRKHEKLKSERLVWEEEWREILSVTFPARDPLFTMGSQGRVDRRMYDSAPTQSSILLASHLHSRLTNPSIQWLGYSTGFADLDRKHKIKQYLEECEFITHTTFNDTNFHTEMSSFYIDMVSTSTAFLTVDDDDDDVLFFKSTPVWNHWIDLDHRGQLDTIHTEYEYDGQQLLQKYGVDSFTKDELEQLEKSESRRYVVVHASFPRADRDVTKLDKKNKKVASVEVLLDFKKLLTEGGYDRLKTVVGRFSVLSTEKYGRGPAHYCLPDCLMIQEMQKVLIRSGQKSLSPPLLLPDDGVMLPFENVPDAINYYRSGMEDEIKYLEHRGNIPIGIDMVVRTEDKIKKAYYADQLQLIENRPQMTATEVDIRNHDNMSLLSPTLARQDYDVLKKLIEIVYPIFEKKELFPPRPQELVGRKIRPFYTSQIARAQKGVLLNNLSSLYGVLEPLAQIDPAIGDAIDSHGTLVYGAEVLDLPSRLFKSKEEYDGIKKAKAQEMVRKQKAEDEMHEANLAVQGSQALRNLPEGSQPEGVGDLLGSQGPQSPQGEQVEQDFQDIEGVEF